MAPSYPLDTVEGGRVGCFSDLYVALDANPSEQVITLARVTDKNHREVRSCSMVLAGLS
jgi:hypothetical protein